MEALFEFEQFLLKMFLSEGLYISSFLIIVYFLKKLDLFIEYFFLFC